MQVSFFLATFETDTSSSLFQCGFALLPLLLLPLATHVRQGMRYFLPQSRRKDTGNYVAGPYFAAWMIKSQISV